MSVAGSPFDKTGVDQLSRQKPGAALQDSGGAR